jgi:hypothetical protein
METAALVSKPETVKDTIQVVVESGATRIGNIALLITGAVRDIAREVGGFASDVFEMLEASRRARADEEKADRDQP